MTAQASGAWNARLLALLTLAPDAIVNLPAPQPAQSMALALHPLGALLHTLSPSAASVRDHAGPCATIPFADQRSIWLRTPTIWSACTTETSGPEWLAWGAHAATLRQRCLTAGWRRIAWLVGIPFPPELSKVACYSLSSDRPRAHSEWLVTTTHIHTLA